MFNLFGKRPQSTSREPQHDDVTAQGSASELLALAESAASRGDAAQSAHLYLAAFDEAAANGKPDDTYVDGLRKAWDAAVDSGERSLAEHVYEKLEPYSTREDNVKHTEHLKGMAIEALREFGLSEDDMEGLSEMISSELSDAGHAMVHLGPGLPLRRHGKDEREPKRKQEFGDEVPGYDTLVGFDRAVAVMRGHGIGMGDDPKHLALVAMLARRHGIDTLPHVRTFLFRAPDREDANRFMLSTARELNLPSVRMAVEIGPHGFPMMSMTMSPSVGNPNRFVHNGFDDEGVLMLEDLDTWLEQDPQLFDDFDSHLEDMFDRSTGEALRFVRTMVDNPQVTVMASCGAASALDERVADAIEPACEVDLEQPTGHERAALWSFVTARYPSLRMHNREELIRLSEGMSRSEIVDAARMSVEDAYLESIEQRRFMPVTRDGLLSRIAEFQPLGSDVHQAIEEAAVRSLRKELASMELDALQAPAAPAEAPAPPAGEEPEG